MATVVDKLVTVVDLDTKRFTAGANQVKSDARGVVGAMDGLKSGGAGSIFSPQVPLAMVGAMAALTAGIGGVGLEASRRAADFESLVAALTAVEGSGAKAAESLRRLREIALGPGLGVQEALTTYSGLRRAGIETELAMRMTRELGNQVAMSGGGKEVLDRVGRAAGQIATKPFLQGEELLQLTEAGLPAYKMVKDIFGTSDTEDLKRRGVSATQVLVALTEAMEKMPRVAGGARNSFDNLSDAIDQAWVSIGTGINAGGFAKFMDDLAKSITKLTSTGVLESLGDNLYQMFANLTNASSADGVLEFFFESLDRASLYLMMFAENVKGFYEYLNDTPGKKLLDWLTGEAADGVTIESIVEGRKRERELLKEKFEMEQRNKARDAISSTPEPKIEEKLAEQVNPLNLIAEYTRQTAENTKPDRLRDLIMGGAAIGGKGIQQREFSRPRGASSSMEARLLKAIREYVQGVGPAPGGKWGPSPYEWAP